MRERFLTWIRQTWCVWRKHHAPMTQYSKGVIFTRCPNCRTRTVGVDLFSEPEWMSLRYPEGMERRL
jgi:hypothetical protein